MATKVQRKLVKAVEHATRQPRFVQTAGQRGSEVAPAGPQAFAEHLEKERERVERTVLRSGLRLD
jgi:tripartite-type tricarboxylate transporter receptor subunit TctC